MRRIRALVSLLVPGVLVLPLINCARPEHAADETYILVASNIKIPYWRAAAAGLSQAARQMQNKGKVVVFTMPEQINLRERLLGYQSMFDSFPEIKIVEVIDIKGNPRVAFDKTMEILAR